MAWVYIAGVALLIAGCAASPPAVSEFNGDSVKVTVHCGMGAECFKPRPEDLAQANQTCGTRGRTAQFASTATRTERSGDIDFSVADHLYICV
jgi:hypothetical protein